MSCSNIKKKWSALLLCSAVVAAAQADDSSAQSVTPLPKYQQECTACHMAFPPGMLPAASWSRIMSTLGKHYGTDASLDAVSAREIGTWLQTHAGTYKSVNEVPQQDRISRTAWFLREHDATEVPASVWKRPAVGSPANCTGCHTHAAQGRFSEREISIPK